MSLALAREETLQQPLPGQEPLVLVADPIAEEGLAILRPHTRIEIVSGNRAALERNLAHAEALLVRSETHVTEALLDAAPRLQVIGRAGAGVDTIDVAAATARGIVVVNAPGGNAVAAAEHTLALMFALARRIAPADASLKRGQWARSAYIGMELTGKTLGLVGLGRVGSEVARRAQGPASPDDPWPRHPKVVATPHLGASTVEAQANVAAQVASEVLAVLEGRPAQFAVNAPSLRPEDIEALEPYLNLVVLLGKLATQ